MKFNTISVVLALLSASAHGLMTLGILDDFNEKEITLQMVQSMPVPESAKDTLVYCMNRVPPEVITYIVDNWKVDVNKVDNCYLTALDYAVYARDIPAALALLKHGAIPSVDCFKRAVISNDLELVRLMNENASIPEEIVCNSLGDAARRGNTAIVKHLLKTHPGLDVNQRLHMRSETLLIAAASFPGDNREILKLLLQRGADITVADKFMKQNCLLKALQEADDLGRYHNFKFLLEAAGDQAYSLITARDDAGKRVIDLVYDKESGAEDLIRRVQEVQEMHNAN